MSKSELALFGGSRTIDYSFRPHQTIGADELLSVTEVLKSGCLSNFYGSWGSEFYGGPKVKEFEDAVRKLFNIKHAISVNSWTSGLVSLMGAIGLEPGDEVIVTPWTMCASVTCILQWCAIPVFVDIEESFFTLDVDLVEEKINPKTKAILAVDIFGQSCDIDRLNALAERYDLTVITDSAQSPGSYYGGAHTGTKSAAGGFSFNYHKHIHTGEGGVIVTNDDVIAERTMLIRNHGEAVVGPKGVVQINNILGQNFRLGEIEASIGIEQLKKLEGIVSRKREIAEFLTEELKQLEGLIPPMVRDNGTHSYYLYGMKLENAALAVGRAKIVEALRSEGVPALMEGYQNVHLLPMYQKKVAYGTSHFPWSYSSRGMAIDYRKGICPVAERLHDYSFFAIGMCAFDITKADAKLIVESFLKVWKNLKYL